MNTLKVTDRTDDELTLENHIILFGGRDLDGEYFSAKTIVDSPQLQLGKIPVDWEHGLQPTEKSGAIGYVDWSTAKVTEQGILVRRILNRRDQYVKMLDDAGLFDAGIFGSSTEANVRGVAKAHDGHIDAWPLIGDTVTVSPAEPRMLTENQLAVIKSFKADFELPEAAVDAAVQQEPDTVEEPEVAMDATAEPATDDSSSPTNEVKTMDEKQESTAVDTAEIMEAIKALQARLDADDKTPVNDPAPAKKTAPNVITDADHWRYDNTSSADLAFAIETLKRAKENGQSRGGASEAALKALARRMDSAETLKTDAGRTAAHAMKAAGIKANEVGQSTLTSYGDEWVGVYYSGALWESIRQETAIVSMLPQMEVPAGAESVVIPLEGTDPIWYKVAQAASLTANPGAYNGPINTVTASTLGTASKTMTLAKLGARVLWTGELEEDAVLPYVAQLRQQLAVSGAEYLESAVIDGDTETSGTTNINDIAGTPAATDWFMTVNGFRKSCLVTTTANSRDAGALTSGDFIETVKLMGTDGSNARDINRVGFIIPNSVHWKALELSDVKTRDVFNGATIENGRLNRIFGYPIYVSYHMHKAQPSRLANSAGKIDLDTAGNNTTGAILAVRWDQWMFGYRRRMTLETTRFPAADSTEIVALMRFGLTQRDTEASAISYNVTV